MCDACLADLMHLARPTERHCPQCGGRGNGQTPCGSCQKKPPPINALHASFFYAPPLSGILHEFKHLRRTALAEVCCQLMLHTPPVWLSETAFDAVLAMPVSRARRLERGFNQCDRLAEAVARRYRLPLLPHHAVFRRPAAPQSTLPYENRHKNVRGAFRTVLPVKNCKILIIDDVLTSGATLSELARTLKQSGAAAVYAWTFTQTQMQKS